MEGVTRESLRPLLDLQRVDTATDRLQLRRADLPEQGELDDLVAQREEIAGARAEKQLELDAAIREQSKLEDEISMIGQKIEHEQERLYSGAVTVAKELANIQAELDALRRRKNHLEDQELEVMERREDLEKEAGALNSSFEDLDAKVADATARRDAATVEIDRELAGLASEREGIAPTLHHDVLELYEDVRAKKGGVGVGALQRGTCGACHLPLSPLAREEIRTTDEPIVRCENCRRLLVVL